jgi:hypothetical protein
MHQGIAQIRSNVAAKGYRGFVMMAAEQPQKIAASSDRISGRSAPGERSSNSVRKTTLDGGHSVS